MRNILIAILAILFLNGCSMWKHGKGTGDVTYMFDNTKSTIRYETPDYLNIPIDNTYLETILPPNSINGNLLFPIKIKSNDTVIMIVTTIKFLYPLYCEQIKFLRKKEFVDSLSVFIKNKTCICLDLPTIGEVGKPFYHVVRNDDWVFHMVNDEDEQVFFNYFFDIRKDMDGRIYYSDGPYKLGAVAEKMFYLKHPLCEGYSCDGTYQWVSTNSIKIKKNVPNISKEMRLYLRTIGRMWYVDGNIKYRRLQTMSKWW